MKVLLRCQKLLPYFALKPTKHLRYTPIRTLGGATPWLLGWKAESFVCSRPPAKFLRYGDKRVGGEDPTMGVWPS